MSSRLALFDLDNTLLAGDSDHAWGEFVIEEGLVDAATHRAKNDEFYEQYLKEDLDIHAYVQFTLQPILNLDSAERATLHEKFMGEVVEPMILESGKSLVEKHRNNGDLCVLITATNSFITYPIAKRLSMDALLATELELENDRLTGVISGTPCYQEGKVEKLQQWMKETDQNFDLHSACFYTDSINDLSLMEIVGEPVAVDPDESLAEIASKNGWQIMSLR